MHKHASIAIALWLAGCGRLGFDAHDDTLAPDAVVVLDVASADAGAFVYAETTHFAASYPSYDFVAAGYSCSTAVMQPMSIYLPIAQAGTKLPLLIYFVGTLTSATDDMSTAIVDRAARLGFVAVAVEYHGYDLLLWHDRIDAKERCVFDSDISATDNVVGQLCGNRGALAVSDVQVDCGRGIVVVGHNQGGVMALLAQNYDPRVRAAYVLDAVAAYDPSSACTNFLDPSYDVECNMFTDLFPYIADPAVVATQVGAFAGPALGSANRRVLPSASLITAAGDIDPYFTPHGATAVTPGDVAARLDNLTGLSCGAGASCRAGAGNGWLEIDASQLDAATQVAPFAGAGHCWFSDGQDPGCTQGAFVPDPNFFAPRATAAWTLEASLRWLSTSTLN